MHVPVSCAIFYHCPVYPLYISVGALPGMVCVPGKAVGVQVLRLLSCKGLTLEAQVLMVVFDLMGSHARMAAWLDAALDAHMVTLAKLREAKRASHARIADTHMPRKSVHSDPVTAGLLPLLGTRTISSTGMAMVLALHS